MQKSLKEKLDELEKDYLAHKAILERFPDVRKSLNVFRSKMVNAEYNHFEFYSSDYALVLKLSHSMDLEYNGELNRVNVFSADLTEYHLIDIMYERDDNCTEYAMTFLDYELEFKKHNVRLDIMGSCQMALIDHITKYQDRYKIDYTNLDPRIKKLLAFM